ncbi:zinc finger protein 12-like [Physella acuta]|uniref:zinc finger protein 12-like n=1 Tax=Physella acuta TaxID=109671 RepID=UPI0027DDFFEA|nr:zinc finger protein 12-like [Physella acuta]
MAKRTPHMSSPDARNNFKTKITDSLPLLGFLNNEDKEDIWRFWKTISSAVKIAVNGKGDFVDTPRRNSKVAKYTRERQLEEYRIQQLDRNAITIYAPVKCAEKGYRKYHVLKLANQKKIADYYETVPSVESEASSTEGNLSEVDLDNFDFTHIANNSSNTPGKSETDVEPEPSGENFHEAVDEDLQSVRSYFKVNQDALSAQNSTLLPPTNNATETSPSKAEKSKPIKKIWPVGRPTTRSSSAARVIRDKFGDSRNIELEDSKEYIKKDCISQARKDDLEVDSITFYPSVKKEVSEEDEDFNITIVPVGNTVMQISESLSEKHSGDNELLDQQQTNEAHDIESEVPMYHQNIQNDNLMPTFQLQVSLGDMTPSDPQCLDSNKVVIDADEQLDQRSYTNNIVELNVEMPTSSVFKSDIEPQRNEQQIVLQSHLTPRNASDIETIISALEEELKKAGSTGAIVDPKECDKNLASVDTIVSVADVHESFDEHSGQTVQILEGEEIIEVQHVGNVIWTSDGEVQVLSQAHMVDNSVAVEAGVSYDGQPVETQYDVVEYEILEDRKLKRGRRKKVKDEADGVKAEVIDRTCPICHRVLIYASSMSAHMRTHTGARPYSCGQCDRKFTTKANRDRHEATHVGLKPFQCSQCSKSFTEKRSLKIHMRTHTGERPFVCTICGRGFTQKCTLKIHMDRHSNKKGHLCDLCGKAFRQKCQLEVHVKRHKRQASYPCNECSTKCYTKGDLVRHMIKHTGERPFRCQLCSRAFTRKQYLVDHENQHYGRKPYRCSLCSATFHDMGSCHRHLRKHKQDDDGENSKGPVKSALLSSTDFHRILEGTQIGQIIKMDDGTEALVKAVTAEADGSTVYHITCLGKPEDKPKDSTDTMAGNSESSEENVLEDGGTEGSN